MAEWAEETIARLRFFWGLREDGEPLSTAEIGRRMGCSKNSVVGKAHRLDLPARPSPIHRDGPKQARVPRHRSPAGTLPALPSARAPPAAALPPAPPPAPRRVQMCCWPLGVPGTKSFRFCDANAKEGKPYCRDHCRLAYRETAA